MTLDQRLIAILTLVAVLCAALVGTLLATAGGRAPAVAPAPALVRNVPAGPDGKLSLLWVGDTMLADAAQPLISQYGYTWPLAGVRPMLAADFTFANVEAPITQQTLPWDSTRRDSYQMLPPAATALAGVGIDGISLANGHSMDRGPTGVTDTIANAQAAGITAIGAGENLEQAQRPLILKSEVGTIGIVAFTEYHDRDSQADRTRPGAMVLDVETIDAALARAHAAGARSVVAYVNWGDNYQAANARQRYWALQFARAGYAMVVGTGSHVAQSVDLIDGMPVVFGLGNLAFGSPGQAQVVLSPTPRVGLAVTTDLGRDRGMRMMLRCISTDNAVVGFQPKPCVPELSRMVLPTLNPRITLRRDAGVLTFPPPVRRVG